MLQATGEPVQQHRDLQLAAERLQRLLGARPVEAGPGHDRGALGAAQKLDHPLDAIRSFRDVYRGQGPENVPLVTGWDVRARTKPADTFPPLNALWEPHIGLTTLPAVLLAVLGWRYAFSLAATLEWRRPDGSVARRFAVPEEVRGRTNPVARSDEADPDAHRDEVRFERLDASTSTRRPLHRRMARRIVRRRGRRGERQDGEEDERDGG